MPAIRQVRLQGGIIQGPKLVCSNIQPYGSTQAPERSDILNIGGLSGAVVNVVGSYLNNDAIGPLQAARSASDKHTPLFCTISRSGELTSNRMHGTDVLRMIKRRARLARLPPHITWHTFRATGITCHLLGGGSLEHAQRIAFQLATAARAGCAGQSRRFTVRSHAIAGRAVTGNNEEKVHRQRKECCDFRSEELPMSALKVFLSHTSQMARLPNERSYVQAALDAINTTGMVPRDMRFFTADARPPAELCVDTVGQCDLYVGLVGLDYGSPVRDRPSVSYTELEFETALGEKERRGMRVLAFLLDETAVGAGPTDERQMAFRQRVLESGITAAKFPNADRLEYLIHRALTEQLPPIDPFEKYVSSRLAEQCNRWFRPDDRIAFHPRDQFVPLSAGWDDGGQTEDIVSDLVARLEAGKDKRFGIAANYGQGKTFLSWKLALTLAGRSNAPNDANGSPPKPIVPLFFPLKELQPNSEKKPLAQVVEYIHRVLPDATSQQLFDSRQSLLILDAADEIPVNRENLTAVLRDLLKAFEAFPRLALLLTFRTGLYPDGTAQHRTELPGFRVSQLDSWKAGGKHWERLLELCEETNFAQFPGGWEQFRDKVAGPPDRPSPLADLTSRPLWCRMIVERRETILEQDIHNVADLYHVYVGEFFESRAGLTQLLSPDQKRRVLELLATSMARKASAEEDGLPTLAEVTEAELRQAAAQTFRILGDSEIAEFVTGEMRTYSLLNCHRYGGDRAFYSFGHYSFQEFFQALAFLRLLQGCSGNLAPRQEDLTGFARRILRSDDLLGFIVGRLRAYSAEDPLSDNLRRKPESAFGSNSEEVQRIRAALLRCWLGYGRDVLQKPRPNLGSFRLDRLTCERLDFSRADLEGANLGGSRFLRCNFAEADLTDSNCRGTTFEDCDVTGAVWTGADLGGVQGL